MSKKYKLFFLVIGLIVIGLITALLTNTKNIAVLNPAGYIADKEHRLLVFTVILMLVIVVPVFAMTFFIAVKYREGNRKARYTPDWDRSKVLESIWWGFPLAIITILSVVTWTSSHQLDPSKPIASSTKPMTIQVVALQWRWLFIYPEQNIATINYLQFPEKTPIDFQITSDAPMNAFWIPKLGGQMYAMSGMSTHLHLQADQTGQYRGSSTNISGQGFAGMNFAVHTVSKSDFASWVDKTRQSKNILSNAKYGDIARPTQKHKAIFFSLASDDLYQSIDKKYAPAAAAGSKAMTH